MHRSRLHVLVIVAAAAACSTHDATEGSDPLAQDRTLVARLETTRESNPLPLPTACGTVVVPAQPVAASRTRAKELTLQGQNAEMQGNLREASSLLRQAFDLDGTNASTAYHLARASEALGERSAALTAYCRYVALTPSATESAEARQRVTELSKPVTRMAGGSVSENTTSRRRARVTSVRRVAITPARRATRERPATVEPRSVASESVQQSAIAASAGSDVGASTESDVVVAPSPLPVDAPSPAPATRRRGPSRTQGAMVGAATGAIIGAATGRNVKGAVIGAAAGGILGAMIGNGSR